MSGSTSPRGCSTRPSGGFGRPGCPRSSFQKTTDAGLNWTPLFDDQSAQSIGSLAIAPSDPSVVWAGTGEQCIRSHISIGDGIYRSTDSGRTWARMGLERTGRIGRIVIHPRDPNTVLACSLGHAYGPQPDRGVFRTTDGGRTWDRVLFIDEESSKVWRSDDGGATWQLVSHNRNAGGRTHYYFHVFVAPDDPDEVYFLTGTYAKSTDGGRTLDTPGFGARPGGDNHDMWIDPANPSRMIVGNDGGVSISVTRGRTWDRINLPIAQMYHVSVDNEIPYNVLGNRQDGPSFKGPAATRARGFGGGAITRGMWHSVSGGESGWAIPDPKDPKIIWASGTGSGGIGGSVDRFDERTGQFRRVEVWPDSPLGGPAADARFRFNWTFPLHLSPHDSNTVYAGSQHVHRTTNGGQSWEVISPDLTLNDRSRQRFSGGLTGDNIGVEYAGTVLAIAESPREKGVLWAGTNDGLVQVTRDNGKTWTNISGTIPKSMLSYVHAIKEDPVRPGLLYLGTENAIYVSWNDGDTWQPLQNNLPHAPVYGIAVQEHFNDLVIATYGRGFWILDDITPLRQLTTEVANKSAHLFEPRAAYRFHPISNAPASVANDPITGENAPYGATINYWLSPAAVKAGSVGNIRIAIEDAQSRTIRTLRGTSESGLNRVVWDLRAEPSTLIKLRTPPLYADWVEMGPEGWRPTPTGSRVSLLMPPGTYTVKLSAGGREQAQTLVVRKDPISTGTEADIQEQFQLLTEVRGNLDAVAGLINDLEVLRRQLADLDAVLDGRQDAAPVRMAATELDQKLTVVEHALIQLLYTGRGQDTTRWPNRLIEKIMHLANDLDIGDFSPSDQQREVNQMHREQIAEHQTTLASMLAQDVRAFNTMLSERGLGAIAVPGRAPR